MLIPTWLWQSLLMGLGLAVMLAIAVSIIKDAVESVVKDTVYSAMNDIQRTVRSAVEDAMSERDWDGDDDDYGSGDSANRLDPKRLP